AEPVETAHEHQMLAAGEAVEEQQAVGNHADATLELVARPQPQDAQAAAGRLEHAGQHGDGGALSRAGLAQKPVEAPARNAQVDAVHRDLLAEPAGQRVRLDGEIDHLCYLAPVAAPGPPFSSATMRRAP